MPLDPEDFLGKPLGFIVEWFFYWALLGASLGLLLAYLVAGRLGFEGEWIYWLAAIVGFGLGIPHDYRDFMEGPDRTSIAIVGYIGFAIVLMACEVLLVLHFVSELRPS